MSDRQKRNDQALFLPTRKSRAATATVSEMPLVVKQSYFILSAPESAAPFVTSQNALVFDRPSVIEENFSQPQAGARAAIS